MQMALSDPQIERYSRQIILGQVGGRGQERLLKSRLWLIGEIGDAARVLAYLVAAGIGTIVVDQIGCSHAQRDRVVAEMRGLNPDARLSFDPDDASRADLIVWLIGSMAALDATIAADRTREDSPLIAARFDTPGAIAILPGRRPCLTCVGARLTRPFARRSAEVGFIAMVAAAEAIKMLASKDHGEAALVDFDGYSARSQTIAALSDCSICRDA